MGRQPFTRPPRARRCPPLTRSQRHADRRPSKERYVLEGPAQCWHASCGRSCDNDPLVSVSRELPFQLHSSISTVFSACSPRASMLNVYHSAGYPMISYFTTHQLSSYGGFNLGGINASGQASPRSFPLSSECTHILTDISHDRFL